jgi:hypothetical protein
MLRHHPTHCCHLRASISTQATQVNGLVYLVTGEYWGTNTTRIPSIYWAALKPTEDICQLSREDQGMVASQEALAFGYPVIAGKRHGLGAVIVFSYSGGDMMAGGLYKAHPGECAAVYCCVLLRIALYHFVVGEALANMAGAASRCFPAP